MRLKRYIGIFLVTLAITACGIQDENTGSSMVQTTLQVVPQNVNRVRFTITGPGMPDIVKVVPVTPGQTITEQFLVPKGPQRLFRVEAFSNLDYVDYLGQKMLNVDQELINLTINASYLVRYPLYHTVTTLPSTDVLYAYDYMNSTSVPTGGIITGVVPVGIVHTSEFDPTTNYIYNIGAKWALFMGYTGTNWVPYRMDLTDSNFNLYALSGSSTPEQPCDYSFVIENPENPLNSWGLINLSGTDGICNNTDDHTIAFRPSSGPSTPLIDLGVFVTDAFGILSFDGNLQGVIYYYTTNKANGLLHCPASDIRPQSCTPVFPILMSLNSYRTAVTPGGTYVLLSIADYTDILRTYHYNPATKTLNELTQLRGKSVTQIITDGQFFYLGAGDYVSTAEVWKVPVDGSAQPQQLVTVSSYLGAGPSALFLAGQRLVVGYLDNTSINSILSINKNGSGSVNLGLDSTNNPCDAPVRQFIHSTESPFVFYSCFGGAAPEGCYVRADGTGRNCTAGLNWHFEPVVYTQNLYGVPFIKMGRILGYDQTGNLISADINNPSNQITLGSAAGVLNTIQRITHYGGGKAMIQIIDFNSLGNAYFADFESANSLQSTTFSTEIFKE